jgi:hypothetical protein
MMVWVGWMEHTWIEYHVHMMVHCGLGQLVGFTAPFDTKESC